MEPLRQVGILLVTLALVVGPVALLMGLLNRRDRREARLFAVVCAGLSPQAMRSDVAVRVRCAVFGRGALVIVDMPAWSPSQVWETMRRLRGLLPPTVELQLEAPMDRALRTRLTVERLGTFLPLPSEERAR